MATLSSSLVSLSLGGHDTKVASASTSKSASGYGPASPICNRSASPSLSSKSLSSKSTSSPTSTTGLGLGFSTQSMTQLTKSRQLLDAFVMQQRNIMDGLQQERITAYQKEMEGIQLKMRELQSIQFQRGVYDYDSAADNCDNGDDGKTDDKNSNTRREERMNRHAAKKKELEERRIKVERDMANLHLEQKDLQRKVEVLRKEEKEVFARAETVRKTKERITKSKRLTVEDLTIAVVKYKELGLDFIKGNDQSLQFNFTKLDDEDEDRVFAFTLQVVQVHIDDDADDADGDDNDVEDVYEVEDCMPELDVNVVLGLVEELNRSDQFPTFIRGMRKAFRDSLLIWRGE
eukprot:CAMPEP_0194111376 /NCGR_PEP_ID=MMETSP0150-20130528/10395_1 /TAXON_ID=122233 /ORGANISM="Chaetoceros debilis, Strain MM31A-1" /LENGTH=346 /DNA_ID=CAMNT_0038800789 /DNA_START=51 /DNA_END=1091 /DNA_ORIENTATION=-